jgi:alkylated DNA repair dioxygenase AlkB
MNRVPEPRNILPYEGESVYYGKIFSTAQADAYLRYVLNAIPWKNDEAMIFGKHFVTARKVAWYGNENYAYTYSNKTRVALPWSRELLGIKQVVENISGVTYNSCLLNLYEDGSQGMGWHHDDEKGLGKDANIASVTFGAERRFDLRHKQSKEKISIILEHGSLLIMRGTTQTYWHHQVPKSKKVIFPRVNLTFRTMV